MIPVNPSVASMDSLAPYYLNVELPVLIVGDELPPGVADPEELAADAAANLPSGPENVCVSITFWLRRI